MSNSDDLRGGLAGYSIDRCHLLYDETGNPVHVWKAYRVARKTGVELPQWVLDYFDAAAGALESNPGKGSEILEALGFATGGRRENRASDQLSWAQTVRILMQKHPDWNLETAYGKVAENIEGVSESSVRDAYNKYFKK